MDSRQRRAGMTSLGQCRIRAYGPRTARHKKAVIPAIFKRGSIGETEIHGFPPTTRGNDGQRKRLSAVIPAICRRGSIKEEMEKQYYVYMLASKRNGTLYTGVTSNLIKRVYEHKNNLVEGFTQKHDVHDLVHYEVTESVESAITREKQLKKWKREWKIRLIERGNPEWKDLYQELL